GVGTVNDLTFTVIVTPPPTIVVPNSGAINNDRGQVLFGATLEDGRSVLLLATPTGQGHAEAGTTQRADADLAALLVGNLQGASAGHSASLAIQPDSAVGQPQAPPAGG